MSCTSSPSYIMTPESDVESPLAISPSAQRPDLRAIVRNLLKRYGMDELQRLIGEESSSSLAGPRRAGSAGLVSPPTLRGIKRHDRPSRTGSSSHVHTPALHSTSTPRHLLAGSDPSQRAQPRLIRSREPTNLSAPRKLDYACGLCAEEGINTTCTRRNDLRRHIENFHNKNALWFCQHPGCRRAFDWQSAYQIHLRIAHGGSHMKIDNAKVKMCAQTVFACGFGNCTRVFEAASEKDAAATLKEYSAHIVKHFEAASLQGRWTYSTRFRNLLRQSRLSALWDKESPETESARLHWDTQVSMTARRILETGRFENVSLLQFIRWVILLGSNVRDATRFQGQFELPVREKCSVPFQHTTISHDEDVESLPQHAWERIMSPFEASAGMHLGYEPYGTMQPGGRQQQAPRAVELYRSEHAVDQGLGQGLGTETSLALHTSPELLDHGASPIMYGQSPSMTPTALQNASAEIHMLAPNDSHPFVSQVMDYGGMRSANAVTAGAMHADTSGGGGKVMADGYNNWMDHPTDPQLVEQSSLHRGERPMGPMPYADQRGRVQGQFGLSADGLVLIGAGMPNTPFVQRPSSGPFTTLPPAI